MEFLKNVKLNHDERRDIDYVQDVKLLEKLPNVGDDFEQQVIESIDKTYVDTEETRQEDYEFYSLVLFDKQNYDDDMDIYEGAGIDENDYQSEIIIAIKKEL